MGRVKLLGAFLLGVIVSACASPIFPYRFYGLDAVNYDGTLKGPKPAQDLNLKECQPPITQPDKAMCMVVKTQDYLLLRNDYLGCKVELEACQRNQ